MAFEKGISGNPTGRPIGTKDRRTILRDMVEIHQEKLVNKAVELALSGNEQMLKLLLDRLLPSKPRDDVIPTIGCLDGTLGEQAREVISSISQGIITPLEGNHLLHSISLESKILEIDELEKRLCQLEQRYANRTKT